MGFENPNVININEKKKIEEARRRREAFEAGERAKKARESLIFAIEELGEEEVRAYLDEMRDVNDSRAV